MCDRTESIFQSEQIQESSGRKCAGACKTFKQWSSFDRKPNGINGHDSRCKSCISKAKKSYKSKMSKRYRDTQTIESKIIGSASQEKLEHFAKIISTCIMNLIDKGVIE